MSGAGFRVQGSGFRVQGYGEGSGLAPCLRSVLATWGAVWCVVVCRGVSWCVVVCRGVSQVALDLQVTKSFGMHWGTFVLTDEKIKEPRKLLAEALIKRQLAPE